MFGQVKRKLRRVQPIDVYLHSLCENTRATFGAAWRLWIDWLNDFDPMTAGEDFAAEFSKHLDDTRAPATADNRISALFAIYDYFQRSGHILANPFALYHRKRKTKHHGQVRPTPLVEFERVPAAIERCGLDDNKSLMHRCFLALCFGGGLRVSEAVQLRLCDISVDRHGVTTLRLVRAKTGRFQPQELPPWAAQEVLRYRAAREEEGAKPVSALLIQYRRSGPLEESIDPRQARRMFNRAMETVGVKASPHAARATSITKLLSDGLTHREVQEFSRHASIRSVEIYDKRTIPNPARSLCYPKKESDDDDDLQLFLDE